MRFSVLDALRGICALIVVIFHIEFIGGIYAGWMHGMPFIEHGFLFVDFFFVLSGFVLTHTYFSRISSAKEFFVFIIRRFGRVYPLHLLFLILFIGLELAKLYAYSRGLRADHAPFEGNYSVPAIFSNIFLIQAFGIHSGATWNSPSWSIGCEFYTYIIFSLFVFFTFGKKRIFIALSAIFSAFGAWMVYNFSRHYINTIDDYAVFRCIYGFFCGAITYFAVNKIWSKFVAPFWVYCFAEAMTSVACIAFVTDTGVEPRSLFAPLVFAAAVAVFSFERGCISLLLKKWPFQFFGGLSYTIYISHAFILVMMGRVFRVMQQKTGYISTVKYKFNNSPLDLMLPVSSVVSNLVILAILASIVISCVLLNRLIEIPCRDYFGHIAKRVQRMGAAPDSVASDAALLDRGRGIL